MGAHNNTITSDTFAGGTARDVASGGTAAPEMQRRGCPGQLRTACASGTLAGPVPGSCGPSWWVSGPGAAAARG